MMHLKSFDYFRGIAIILIVSGHSLIGFFKYDHTLIYNFISGSSTYFVFISGFLFQWLMNDRYSYQAFLLKKYRNLVKPYLICSVPALIYMFAWNRMPPVLGEPGRYEGTLLAFLTGRQMIAYWYIPFITIIFLLAPLHLWFAIQRRAVQLALLTLTFVMSLLLHRSIGMVNTIHNVMYFLPIFWFGIFAALNKEVFVRRARYWWIFALAGLACLYYHSCVDLIYGSYEKPPFVYVGIDFMLLQKTAFIISALLLTDWLQRFELPGLAWLAHISFPMYFLHGYFVFAFYETGFVGFIDNATGSSMLASLISLVLVLSMTISLVLILKKILGSHSREVIGG